jgi:hypothetical protein
VLEVCEDFEGLGEMNNTGGFHSILNTTHPNSANVKHIEKPIKYRKKNKRWGEKGKGGGEENMDKKRKRFNNIHDPSQDSSDSSASDSKTPSSLS